MQIRFIVANAQSALLGHALLRLPDIDENNVSVHTGTQPYLEKNGKYDPNKPTTVNVGEVEDISSQANLPKQLRQPPQPTKQEQEQHRITHMPYRSWRPICVKAKEQSVHHRRGALKEQSLIQLDYAYTRSSIPTNKIHEVAGSHNPDMCGTTTGLCMALPSCNIEERIDEIPIDTID
eukprot:6491626-Amphidinium_carterae.2